MSSRKLLDGVKIVAVILMIGIFVYTVNRADAFTSNNGTVSYAHGSTASNTNRGRIEASAYTYGTPGAFGTSFRLAQVVNTALQFVVNKAAPTRSEKMIGYQMNNGSLYIDKCTNGCTTSTNLSNAQWNKTIVASNVVTRAYDITYEQTSGRTMVVYAGNTTGKLYYCIYDGTTWGPLSSCTPTNGTNDISLTDGTTTMTGTPTWVKLTSLGSQFGANRSNKILLTVEDSNNNVMVISWSGTAWVTADSKVLTTTGGSTVTTTDSGSIATPAFDTAFESVSGTEYVVYADGTALKYASSTGSGWSAATTIQTLGTAAAWVRMASDPLSNRMSLIIAFSTTTRQYIWKTDGTTVGWTVGNDLTLGLNVGQNVDTVWEKAHSGTAKAIFSSTANANTQQPDWSSWTQAGGFVAWAALTTTSGNILVGNELATSPNADSVTMLQADQLCRLRARTFNAETWSALLTTGLTTQLVDTTTGCNTGTAKSYTQKPYQFVYTPYSTWSLNWKFYSDYATAGNPTAALAAQDTAPTVQTNQIVRLRVNFAELSGNAQADTRKKLQYSSGAGCPDSITCTWTDVGASGGGSIWRYATGGLSDNTAVPSTLLTGSTAVGRVFLDGTSTATGASQTASSIQEYDYTIQSNGAANSTYYYFRAHDFAASITGGSYTNLTPIYREQIINTSGTELTNCNNGTTSVVCTYPTIYSFFTAPNAPTFYVPVDGATSVPTNPTLELKSADILNNYVQYTIEWCPSNSWPCPSGGGSFDQTSSQTGWSGQNANSSTAYATSFNESSSTMALYAVPAVTFLPNTTYYLRARAIDPGGTNSYGPYSSIVSFTTTATSVQINGGTSILGGTAIQ